MNLSSKNYSIVGMTWCKLSIQSGRKKNDYGRVVGKNDYINYVSCYLLPDMRMLYISRLSVFTDYSCYFFFFINTETAVFVTSDSQSSVLFKYIIALI